jgi:hypothetical protein
MKIDKVFECYVGAKSIDDAVRITGLCWRHVEKQYTTYMIENARIESARNTHRLAQIKTIERELFRLIETKPKSKLIDNMVHIYSTFIA